MKKVLYVLGLGLISGSLYAACFGPFCYTDTGASINANTALQSYTLAVATSTAFPIGTQVFVSNAAGGGGAGTVCVSTANVVNSLVLSTGTVCK